MERSLRPKNYSLILAEHPTRVIPEHFLSFTIDTSLIIGGNWWGKTRGTVKGLSPDRVTPLNLEASVLSLYARQLTPALLRIGGTEADRIRYGFRKEGFADVSEQPSDLPGPDERVFVLKKKLWKRLCAFASDNGFRLLFTLGAGPESRTEKGNWDPGDARRLVSYSARKSLPVAAWEFGNEVNAFPFLFGLRQRISGKRYSREFAQFALLVHTLQPGAMTVGPASAIWPLVGEPNPLLPALCRGPAAGQVDALSFHYYPQQSSRGRVAVRRAGTMTLLNPRVLNGARRWVRHVRRAQADTDAARAPIWVTETGHALYGGEPGISDTWLSTPWWLDQLGLFAVEGVDTVFRQALIGGDYGLLNQKTFLPRPDYFASFLWKRLIGTDVFPKPSLEGPDQRLRAWHFGGRAKQGQLDGLFEWLVLINLNQRRPARIGLERSLERLLILEPDGDPRSSTLKLNGAVVTQDLVLSWTDPTVRSRFRLDTLPSGLVPVRQFQLPPLACAFAAIRSAADAPAT